MTKIVMPRLSLTMKEGTVVQWFKKEGDTVQKGEPLVEVLSEKVTYDVESPESGILHRILVGEGSNVPIGQAIGIIVAPNESITEAAVATHVRMHEDEKAPVASKPEVVAEAQAAERVLASPAARRLARELGVDLTRVKGAGPEGRIVEDDVRRFAEQPIVLPRVRQVIPLTGIRKTTAERLSFSARTAPHSAITMEIDMTNAAKLRKELGASYTDLLVKAVAIALGEHPLLNATLEGEQIKVFDDVNVGVAVATEKGLLVPVVHNADQKTLEEISAIVNELVEKAKQGKLSKEDLTGGTFTISNLGMYGVDVFIPIINPPETAILGIGRIAERPTLVNDQLKTKPVMQLSLSYDHRIVDGAPAAQFLQKVKHVLESQLNPV